MTHIPYNFYPITKTRINKKYIFGFYQNYDTVKDIGDILRREFEIITPASPENIRIKKEIESCNSVCVHIRRGDYIGWSGWDVCGYHYFNTAIEEAKVVIENPVFYIFSNGPNDIAWIRENYHFGAEIRYVNLNNPNYEELRLMEACKHFIISNSTFSWWAAYLSPSNNKKVWAPNVWCASCPETMCILPDEWKTIDV